MKTTKTYQSNKLPTSEHSCVVPETSQEMRNLMPDELKVAMAILEKEPGGTWESIAKGLSISRRHLFTLRGSKRIQDAVYAVSRQILRSDFVDVLNTLTKKAKAGDNAAMRLFLELIDKYDEADKIARSTVDPHAWLRARLGDGPPDDTPANGSLNQSPDSE